MMDGARYTSQLAEIIDATGNFINNVKNTSFVITIIVLGMVWFFGYHMMGTLVDLKIELQEQTMLFKKQNEMCFKNNKLTE